MAHAAASAASVLLRPRVCELWSWTMQLCCCALSCTLGLKIDTVGYADHGIYHTFARKADLHLI